MKKLNFIFIILIAFTILININVYAEEEGEDNTPSFATTNPFVNFCVRGGNEERNYTISISGPEYTVTQNIAGVSCQNIEFPSGTAAGDVVYKLETSTTDYDEFYSDELLDIDITVSTRFNEETGELYSFATTKQNTELVLKDYLYTIGLSLNVTGNMMDPNANYLINVNGTDYTISKTSPVTIDNLKYSDTLIIRSNSEYMVDVSNKIKTSEFSSKVKYKSTDEEIPSVTLYDNITLSYDLSPATGLRINALPFILLLIISVAGYIMFFKRPKNKGEEYEKTV